MSKGIVLETSSDKKLELRTMQRVQDLCPGTTFTRFPDLSVVDFALVREGEVTALIEVKTRKETVNTIKGYGGLMLKQKKLVELQSISKLMNVHTSVVFSFENAEGEMWMTTSLDIDAEPTAPPVRRNYRGLACDEDPVLYLDWTKHIKKIA